MKKHRTRKENAARKAYRLINERKAAKAARTAPTPKGPKGPTTHAGERFGRLVAVALEGVNERGFERWTFQCACGARVSRLVGSVVGMFEDLGFAGCHDCYLIGMCLRRLARLPAPHLSAEENARPVPEELGPVVNAVIRATGT